MPQQTLCCGRPLYDWGMLNTAKHLLGQILDALRDDIRAGTPIVGLEPSCVSVFRDELVNLFPNDVDALRLSKQTYLLSEFLQRLEGYRPPTLERKAIVHGHCHHKSIMKMDDERTLLKNMGIDFKMPSTGCCGMARCFRVRARRALRSVDEGGGAGPAACSAAGSSDSIIIADGFSCREQIMQSTNKRGLHVAEVLQMALRAGKLGVESNRFATSKDSV